MEILLHKLTQPYAINIGTQGVQELFFCVWSVGDRSIHGTVYSNDLVDLTSFFGCDVQQERNWEFMMYMWRYIGRSEIAK